MCLLFCNLELTFCPRICCTHELINSSRFSICMFPHYSEKETSFEKLFPPIASDLCCGPHSHNLNSEIQIQQRCLKLMGPFLEKIKSLEKKFCIKKKTQPRCSKGSWSTPWLKCISSRRPPFKMHQLDLSFQVKINMLKLYQLQIIGYGGWYEMTLLVRTWTQTTGSMLRPPSCRASITVTHT